MVLSNRPFWLVGLLVVMGAAYWSFSDGHSAEFEIVEDQAGRVVGSETELLKEHSDRLPPLAGGKLERGGENEPAVMLERETDEKGQTVLTLALKGFSDDSVKGERVRWVLKKTGDGQIEVVEKGRQHMCWRGGNADKWISGTLCP